MIKMFVINGIDKVKFIPFAEVAENIKVGNGIGYEWYNDGNSLDIQKVIFFHKVDGDWIFKMADSTYLTLKVMGELDKLFSPILRGGDDD
jgi:hypothetical protein